MIPYRLIAEIAAGVILVAIFLRHEHALVLRGEQKCQAADDVLVAKMVAENAAKEALQADKLRMVQNDYEKEIAANTAAATAAAARPARVIRVCNGGVSADRGPVPPSTEGEAGKPSGAGSLPEGRGESAITYFNPTPLFAVLDEADRIVAECRRYQESTQ